MWNSLPLLERSSTFIAKWKYCDWGQVVKGSIFELKNRPATWACSFWKNQYRKYRVISGLFKLFHSFFDFPVNCTSTSSLSVDQNALRIIHIMTEHGYLPNCSFRNSRKTSECFKGFVCNKVGNEKKSKPVDGCEGKNREEKWHSYVSENI